MNKKAFTVVELIATMVIMCALFLVVTPIVINMMRGSEIKIDAVVDEMIKKATALYISDNNTNYPQLDYAGEYVDINLKKLVDKGLLNEPIINPSNNKELPLEAIVRGTVQDNKSLKYTYLGLVTDDVAPKIMSKYGAERYVASIENLDFKNGMIAFDNVDGDLKENLTYEINQTTPTQYTVTYSVTDSSNNTATFVLNVIIDENIVELNFDYTGTYQEKEDENYYYIEFLTSGILKINRNLNVDAFLVGGGGGADVSGGGGGYTRTYSTVELSKNENINVIVGLGGLGNTNPTSPYNSTDGGFSQIKNESYRVAGGKAGLSNSQPYQGGAGGSGGGAYNCSYGGNGGSDGSDGTGGSGIGSCTANSIVIGIGQGTTTRAFGEPTGQLYAGGGAGGFSVWAGVSGGTPGAGGGGVAGDASVKGGDGAVNTGSGGGGGHGSTTYANSVLGGNGGSGIVIIRWAK